MLTFRLESCPRDLDVLRQWSSGNELAAVYTVSDVSQIANLQLERIPELK